MTAGIATPADGRSGIAVVTSSERAARPILWWASFGGFFLALNVLVWSRWLLSGHAEPTPVGPSHVPGFMRVIANVGQPVGVLAGLSLLYLVLVRPWLREGRPTAQGLVAVSCLLLLFQDPLTNFVSPYVTFNSVWWNRGSWAMEIPWWLPSNGNRLAHPLLWSGPVHLLVTFGVALIAARAMGRVRGRWPRLGNPGLVITAYALVFGTGTALGLIFGVAGIRVFPGPIKGLTLFSGHYWQYPLYEPAFWAVAVTAIAAVLFYRDPNGLALAEAGIDRLPSPGKRRHTLLRFMALNGLVQGIFLFGYIAPIQLMTFHNQTWARDIVTRSYLTNLICGPTTDRACPSADVPVSWRGSAYIDLNGNLVVPPGVRLPRHENVDQSRARGLLEGGKH